MDEEDIIKWICANSNTTLVKVKYMVFQCQKQKMLYSNTTLVKVKLKAPYLYIGLCIWFKYNTC